MALRIGRRAHASFFVLVLMVLLTGNILAQPGKPLSEPPAGDRDLYYSFFQYLNGVSNAVQHSKSQSPNGGAITEFYRCQPHQPDSGHIALGRL